MGAGLQPSSSEPASSVSPLLLLEIEELPGGDGRKEEIQVIGFSTPRTLPLARRHSQSSSLGCHAVLPNFQAGQATFECLSCPILALPGEAGCEYQAPCWFCCKEGGEPGGLPEPPALLL